MNFPIAQPPAATLSTSPLAVSSPAKDQATTTATTPAIVSPDASPNVSAKVAAKGSPNDPSPPAPAVAPPDYILKVVRGESELREHAAAWDDLARAAAEPNAFYESWNLLPALQAFSAGCDLRFVLIYQPANAQRAKPVLCGFFPLLRRRLHRLVPVAVMESWRHPYCFLTTPLLRTGHAVRVLELLFDWLATDPDGAALWAMEVATRDGPFGQALVQVCFGRSRPSYSLDTYARALIHLGESGEAYLQAAIPGRRRKDYRRRERLLAEQGRLEKRVLDSGGDVRAWIDDFLRLEASGWKGQEGTAILAKAADADYFRTTARAAFERGQLMMLGLFLDGRPISMKYNLLSGSGSFACKIAMDESFPACSPGVLLELFNIEQLHAGKAVRWMDSCAAPNHPMIDRLWAERRVVHTQLIATGRSPGDLIVSVLPLARWLRRCLRFRPLPPAQTVQE